MIIFKILLIILIAAPAVGFSVYLFIQARGISVRLNRKEKAARMEKKRRESGHY